MGLLLIAAAAGGIVLLARRKPPPGAAIVKGTKAGRFGVGPGSIRNLVRANAAANAAAAPAPAPSRGNPPSSAPSSSTGGRLYEGAVGLASDAAGAAAKEGCGMIPGSSAVGLTDVCGDLAEDAVGWTANKVKGWFD